MIQLEDLRRQFYARTGGSRRLFDRARWFLPGGAARGATAFQPYPLYGRQARGAVLTDVDGNEFVDFNLEGGSCIFGHCAPQITERVKKQLDCAEVMSLASTLEVELAERVTQFIDCVEMMRFVNSGSEACAIAARVARAFTGKPMIAMCEGHHHGQLDALLFSHYGPPAGPPEMPATVCDSLGMPEGSEKLVLILPFNNTVAATELIRANASRLAAVFLEPLTIFGGAIPALPEFVRALREVTSELHILMVVDEVPAGIRIGRGGAIGTYGVRPDLFITGKALAGGLPIGMFGGRRDILEPLLSPPYNPQCKVLSSGTFSANPMVMSACLAVLDALESGEVHRTINRLGDQVRDALRALGRDLGVPTQVTGSHSIFGLNVADRPVHDVRHSGHGEWRRDFALVMMANGVLWPPGRIAGFLCTAHTEEHIEKLLRGCRQALELLVKPAIPAVCE
jgi:glutamate-1-semialdehyde 2,1-aminomutase